jgi:hypothetical protein
MRLLHYFTTRYATNRHAKQNGPTATREQPASHAMQVALAAPVSRGASLGHGQRHGAIFVADYRLPRQECN